MQFLKKHKTPLKILISLLILGVLFMRMDMASLAEISHSINGSTWLWATLLVLLQIFLISSRWSLLVNIGEKKIPYLEAIRITVLSMIANLLFITSIGGVVVRVALAMQHGVTLTKALFSTLLDRMMTFLALLILTLLLFSNLKAQIPDELYLSLSIFMASVALTGLFAIPLLFHKTYEWNVFKIKRIEPIVDYMRMLMTDQVKLAKIIGLSVLAQSVFLLAVFLIIESTGFEGPALPVLAILPVLSIVASLPIGFGGWGIREGAFVFGLGLLGFPIETAFLISVQIGLISILATLVASAPIFLSGQTLDIPFADYLKARKKN